MNRDLRGAKVVLIYGPGHLGIDCAGGLWRGLERGLLDLGAEVRTLNLALFKRVIPGPNGQYRSDNPMIRGIVEFLKESWPVSRVDVCLGLFHDAYLSEAMRETLRHRCHKIINYPLNLLDQPTLFTQALEFCDETFCSEEAALSSLRTKFGEKKVRYVPMACDPWNFRPIGYPAIPRLLFVGSFYSDREWLLDQCSRAMPVSAFGHGHDPLGVVRGIGRELVRHGRLTGPAQTGRMLWRAVTRDRRHVSDEEFVRLASEHGVSVGFSEVRNDKTGQLLHKVRLREYEATMTGLCHIARRLPETARHFEDGKEILLYDDPGQIPDLLRQIARGSRDFKAIGRAARARAESEHTWTVRLRKALCQ
jgi:glycosyltransferase involved in cell wall biosynthesis